jgi:hypothetical protein
MFMLDPIKGIFFHGGSCYVFVLFANQVYKNTGATQMIAYTVLSNISFLLYVHMGLQCILL